MAVFGLLLLAPMVATAQVATPSTIDFCKHYNAVLANSLLQGLDPSYQDFIALLDPNTGDLNGSFSIEFEYSGDPLNPLGDPMMETVMITGNGIYDGSNELRLLEVIMRNPSFSVNGITQAQVVAAWNHNKTQLLQVNMGSTVAMLLPSAVPGLAEILIGLVTLGDGDSQVVGQVASGTGSFGFVSGIFKLLSEAIKEIVPSGFAQPILNKADFITLPQLCVNADSDGDGWSNGAEFKYSNADLCSRTPTTAIPDGTFTKCVFDVACMPNPPCALPHEWGLEGSDLVTLLGPVSPAGMIDALQLTYDNMDFEQGDAWVAWYNLGSGAEPPLGDGIVDGWELDMLARVLCCTWTPIPYKVSACSDYPWGAYVDTIRADYDANVAQLKTDLAALAAAAPAGPRKTMLTALSLDDWKTRQLAGLLGLSQDLQDGLIALFQLTGITPLAIYTGAGGSEIFNASGDPDADGLTNTQELANVLLYVGGKESFVLQALYNDPFWPGNPNLPVAGLAGLALLAGACALGGASVIRRKK
jgi:hypothetical protein